MFKLHVTRYVNIVEKKGKRVRFFALKNVLIFRKKYANFALKNKEKGVFFKLENAGVQPFMLRVPPPRL